MNKKLIKYLDRVIDDIFDLSKVTITLDHATGAAEFTIRIVFKLKDPRTPYGVSTPTIRFRWDGTGEVIDTAYLLLGGERELIRQVDYHITEYLGVKENEIPYVWGTYVELINRKVTEDVGEVIENICRKRRGLINRTVTGKNLLTLRRAITTKGYIMKILSIEINKEGIGIPKGELSTMLVSSGIGKTMWGNSILCSNDDGAVYLNTEGV